MGVDLKQFAIVLAVFLFSPIVSAQNAVFVDTDGSAFWWQGESPTLTDFDDRLLAASEKTKVPISFPKTLAKTSKLYKTSELSVANAQNFAKTFGAKNGVRGTIRMSPVSPVAGKTGVQAELMFTMFSTGISTKIVRVAFGADEAEASSLAYDMVATSLLRRLQSESKSKSADVGLVSSENDVEVSVESASLFSDVLNALRAAKLAPTVTWASAGRVVLSVSNGKRVAQAVAGLSDVSVTQSEGTVRIKENAR